MLNLERPWDNFRRENVTYFVIRTDWMESLTEESKLTEAGSEIPQIAFHKQMTKHPYAK